MLMLALRRWRYITGRTIRSVKKFALENAPILPIVGEADEIGIPKCPSWSVHELLASYPRPTISSATLARLHELSALVPPKEGTEAHAKLTEEMEELVRLVEAVKLVDVEAVEARFKPDSALALNSEKEELTIPDGRVWPAERGMPLSSNTRDVEFDPEEISGRGLLEHAARTVDGFYVVESNRRRK